jgi:hypothetical protein
VPLRKVFRINTLRVPLKSGYLYKFYYKGFQHDPYPIILYLYAIKGVNPDTGNRHNYIQGINLNYIPRQVRRTFADAWIPTLSRYNGSIRLTWEATIQKFPFLRLALRRYMLTPGVVTKLEELKIEKIYDEIVKSQLKDFSKQAFLDLMEKYPSARWLVKKGFDFGIGGLGDLFIR